MAKKKQDEDKRPDFAVKYMQKTAGKTTWHTIGRAWRNEKDGKKSIRIALSGTPFDGWDGSLYLYPAMWTGKKGDK